MKHMIIDHNISQYIVLDTDGIICALRKIDQNEDGLVFCTQEDGFLLGVFTDGDFRRWVINESTPDLDQSVAKVINRQFVYGRFGDSIERISGLLSKRVRFIPLLDAQGRLVAISRPRKAQMVLGKYRIGVMQPCFVIAEIGNNHNGSIELARRLVDEAILAGADCVKFQMRDLRSLYSNQGDSNDAREDLGSQYTLDLLKRFQLSKEELFRVFDYCLDKNVIPLCTPWDILSLEDLQSYGLMAYKSASADLTNHNLLEAIALTGKPLICSTGMSNDAEIMESVDLLRKLGAQFALLHCNSTYPAPFRDINLRYMDKLRSLGECPVGYSSHDRGFHVPIAAVSLGANIIEKHLTLDRHMEGNDHRVSLLPKEFGKMVEVLRQIESALGDGEVRRMSQGEMINRESLGKSLFVSCFIRPGEVIEDHMLQVKSPGRGLQPNRKKEISGKVAKRLLAPGDVLYQSDLAEETVCPRVYKFERPFGIPVRYHDVLILGQNSNFDLLEFHLSYKDLTENISSHFDCHWEMDLVVHAPELFEADHILNLCANDPEYRSHSVCEFKRVVEITLRLKEWFPRAERPRIIVNVGGFTRDKPLSATSREPLYELILEALDKISLDGVEVIPQTMPPFPWHFGGQSYHNLFVDPDEIRAFCDNYGFRVCLDTSHSKLACNHHKWSFSEFIEKVGPVSAHLHISDAQGVDGEGLQIGEGEIDIRGMCKDLNCFAPKVSFIPEVWQGHKNSGESFWRALSHLEGFL